MPRPLHALGVELPLFQDCGVLVLPKPSTGKVVTAGGKTTPPEEPGMALRGFFFSAPVVLSLFPTEVHVRNRHETGGLSTSIFFHENMF